MDYTVKFTTRTAAGEGEGDRAVGFCDVEHDVGDVHRVEKLAVLRVNVGRVGKIFFVAADLLGESVETLGNDNQPFRGVLFLLRLSPVYPPLLHRSLIPVVAIHVVGVFDQRIKMIRRDEDVVFAAAGVVSLRLGRVIVTSLIK